MTGPDSYGNTKFMMFKVGPIWDAELPVWDAKNLGSVSPGTHRNKFVKKSLPSNINISETEGPPQLGFGSDRIRSFFFSFKAKATHSFISPEYLIFFGLLIT